MRFCNWVSATGIRHFVNRNYYHPLTFDISYLLRDIPTSIYALKMLRPGTDVSSSPLATGLSSRQNHVCFKLCIQPNILKLKQATKIIVAHVAKCWTRCHIFRNVENEMLNPVPYFSKHSVQSYTALLVAVSNASKPQMLQVCRSCWVFTEITWNLSIRSKATWAKPFLMLLAYRKQIIQNQCKTVGRIITINVCWRKSSCERFPLATSYAKVADSGSGKMWQLATVFSKKSGVPADATGKSARYSSSLLPSSALMKQVIYIPSKEVYLVEPFGSNRVQTDDALCEWR